MTHNRPHLGWSSPAGCTRFGAQAVPQACLSAPSVAVAVISTGAVAPGVGQTPPVTQWRVGDWRSGGACGQHTGYGDRRAPIPLRRAKLAVT